MFIDITISCIIMTINNNSTIIIIISLAVLSVVSEVVRICRLHDRDSCRQYAQSANK